MLQSLRLKDHMKTIGIDQSVCNRSSFDFFVEEHKNIYQHAGKCDEQKTFKDILEAAMVSNPE